MITRSRKVLSPVPVTPKQPPTVTRAPTRKVPKRVLHNATDQIKVSNAINQDKATEEKIQHIYEDIKSVPSYSAKITDFLRNHPTHSVHRRVVRRFPRRRVIARFPYELFMADLIEYRNYKRANRGYSYILLVIDCFSRMVYASPMKSKSADDSLAAFKHVFEDLPRFPIHLVTDKGKEFFNGKLQRFFVASGVNHYATPSKSESKASLAERAIRTIKSRLQKVLFTRKSFRWIDVIDNVCQNYNQTPHRSIGMKPVDVTAENREVVYKRLYPFLNLTVVCRLKIGDKVRKVREKNTFDKGYKENWSEQTFIVNSVKQSNSVCFYTIKTLDNKSIPGIFYYQQLNLVSRNDS